MSRCHSHWVFKTWTRKQAFLRSLSRVSLDPDIPNFVFGMRLLHPRLHYIYLFKVDLIEKKGSGSLLFTLPKTQLSKCQRALKLFGSITSTSSKSIPEVDETKLKLPKRTEKRHAREWIHLHQLTEQQSVHAAPRQNFRMFLSQLHKPRTC